MYDMIPNKSREALVSKGNPADFTQLSTEHLLCRDLKHHWKPFTVKVVRSNVTRKREIWRIMHCDQCSTKRTQRLASDGAILANSYYYPEGYLLTPGTGRMTASDRRQMRLLTTERWTQS